MSPEAVDYMSMAEHLMGRAEAAFAAKLYEDAARDAYLVALNAARAINFEKSGNATKTHSGTRTQFHALLHHGLVFDADLAKFLSEGFDVKLSVDYGPIRLIDRELAEGYIAKAKAFLAAAKAVCA